MKQISVYLDAWAPYAPTRNIAFRSTSTNYSLNQSSYCIKYNFKRTAFTRSQKTPMHEPVYMQFIQN